MLYFRNLLSGLLLLFLFVGGFSLDGFGQVSEIRTLSAYYARAEIASPSRMLSFTLREEGGDLYYTLSHDGRLLVDSSRLGLQFLKTPSLTRNLQIIKIDRTDTILSSFLNEAPRAYNELGLQVRDVLSKQIFTLRVHLFDDGLRFRYELPLSESVSSSFLLVDEVTEFVLPSALRALWQRGGIWARYDTPVVSGGISDISLARSPLFVELSGGGWLSLEGSGLLDYSTMRFWQSSTGYFQVDLVRRHDGIRVLGDLPLTTPWRVLRFGADLSALNDTRAIGRYALIDSATVATPLGTVESGSLDSFPGGVIMMRGQNDKSATAAVNFASENGFSGVLLAPPPEGARLGFDVGDFDIGQIAAYAHSLGVRLVAQDEFNDSDLMVFEQRILERLGALQSYGVGALRLAYPLTRDVFPYIDSNGFKQYEPFDGQIARAHYRRLARAAQTHGVRLILDGIVRTIADEGGFLFTEDATIINKSSAFSLTVLPLFKYHGFRGVLGQDRDSPRSISGVLALYVLYDDSLRVLTDWALMRRDYPAALPVIADLPHRWGQQKTLVARPGDSIAIARQVYGREAWYIGAFSAVAQSLSLDLSFLPAGERYQAMIYSRDLDGSLKVDARILDSGSAPHFNIGAGDGVLLYLELPSTP